MDGYQAYCDLKNFLKDCPQVPSKGRTMWERAAETEALSGNYSLALIHLARAIWFLSADESLAMHNTVKSLNITEAN